MPSSSSSRATAAPTRSPPSRYVMRLQPTPERASGAEGAAPNSPGWSAANKPQLRLNIPRVNNPDSTPLRVSFRERSASPPTGDELDAARRRAAEEEEEERLRRAPEQRARLAEAIRKFYARHAPHKAHQADAIAKAFLARRGGVEELMGKLKGIYGDVPKFSLGGGNDSDGRSDGDESSMSTSTEQSDETDGDDDDDDSGDYDDDSDDSLSKYDHTRRDSRGPETRSPERRPRRVQDGDEPGSPRLVAALEAFYAKYAPAKGFQAPRIAQVYGRHLDVLYDKLQHLYGDIPDYEPSSSEDDSSSFDDNDGPAASATRLDEDFPATVESESSEDLMSHSSLDSIDVGRGQDDGNDSDTATAVAAATAAIAGGAGASPPQRSPARGLGSPRVSFRGNAAMGSPRTSFRGMGSPRTSFGGMGSPRTSFRGNTASGGMGSPRSSFRGKWFSPGQQSPTKGRRSPRLRRAPSNSQILGQLSARIGARAVGGAGRSGANEASEPASSTAATGSNTSPRRVGDIGASLLRQQHVSPPPLQWSLNHWPALGTSESGYRGPIGSSPQARRKSPARALRSPRTSMTIRSPRGSLGSATMAAGAAAAAASMGSPRSSFTTKGADGSATENAISAASAAAAQIEGSRPLSVSPQRRGRQAGPATTGRAGSPRGRQESVDRKAQSLSPVKRSLRARALQVRAAIRFKNAFGPGAFGPDAAAKAAAAAAVAAGLVVSDPRESEMVQPEDTRELKPPNRFRARAQQVRAAIRFRSAFAAAGMTTDVAIHAAAAAVRNDRANGGDSNEDESFADDFDTDDSENPTPQHRTRRGPLDTDSEEDEHSSNQRSSPARAHPVSPKRPPFQTGAKASGFLCPLCHSRFDEMETLLRHHDICDGTPVESPGRQHADTGLSDSETDSSEDMSVGVEVSPAKSLNTAHTDSPGQQGGAPSSDSPNPEPIWKKLAHAVGIDSLLHLGSRDNDAEGDGGGGSARGDTQDSHADNLPLWRRIFSQKQSDAIEHGSVGPNAIFPTGAERDAAQASYAAPARGGGRPADDNVASPLLQRKQGAIMPAKPRDSMLLRQHSARTHGASGGFAPTLVRRSKSHDPRVDHEAAERAASDLHTHRLVTPKLTPYDCAYITPDHQLRDIFVPKDMDDSPKPALIPQFIHRLAKDSLPRRLEFSSWFLRFSNIRDGNRLQSLYATAASSSNPSSAFVLAVSSPKGHVFGAFFNGIPHSTFRPLSNGETFLFTCNPKSRTWNWDQSSADEHHIFMRADDGCISFGSGGDGWGLWLSADFEQCLTARCATFSNDPLFQPPQITPERIELWEIVH